MGPPNQHAGEKMPLREGDGEGVITPLADQTPAGPGGDVAGKTAPHKSR